MLLIPLLLTIAAVCLAIVMLVIDGALGGDAVPEWLRFGQQGARSLLVTQIGAFLTVVALVFWVRMLAVQLASDEFSSRLLRPFLDDRVHQEAMGTIIAALAYCLVVLRAVPDGSAGMTEVPHLSVALAGLLAVVAAGLVVAAIYSGAERTRIGWVLRWLANETVEGIRRRHPPLGSEAGEGWLEVQPPDPPDGPSRVVRTTESGWVRRISEADLLRALPPDGVAQLDVRAGVFVVEGRPLARVWDGDPEGDSAGKADDAIRDAISLGIDPSIEEDASNGIRHLCDIADRAATSTGVDSTTVHEVIMYVSLVLKELLLRDLPAPTRADPQGRTLLRPRELALHEHVDLAVGRLRRLAKQSAGVAELLLDTVGMLVETLEEHGLHQRADHLRHQGSLILADIERRGDLVDIDKRRVRDRALRSGAVRPD